MLHVVRLYLSYSGRVPLPKAIFVWQVRKVIEEIMKFSTKHDANIMILEWIILSFHRHLRDILKKYNVHEYEKKLRMWPSKEGFLCLIFANS